jgi:rsbT co-antagonist protein RsbR
VRGQPVLPIIGVLDPASAPARSPNGSARDPRQPRQVVVIDITEVCHHHSTVANHLVQTVDASGLMGASVIITGLSSDIALTR